MHSNVIFNNNVILMHSKNLDFMKAANKPRLAFAKY